jgi:hypothetical protein
MKDSKVSPVILERLKSYSAATDQQLVNAAKEILQELALLGLSRSGFFKQAAFHGGTALRIFYGLQRFSEDLDFALITPDPSYDVAKLLKPLELELSTWGLEVELVNRSKLSSAVQKAFLKVSSLGVELRLVSPLPAGQKFNVKIELDTNPPLGATCQSRLCEYPVDFYVVCHDEPTLFSGKIHALLCREYIKGRDWFDLLFYLTRKTRFNLPYLINALLQTGPYVDLLRDQEISLEWVISELIAKINAVDFEAIKVDVQPFVADPKSLEIWSRDFFLQKVDLWRRN